MGVCDMTLRARAEPVVPTPRAGIASLRYSRIQELTVEAVLLIFRIRSYSRHELLHQRYPSLRVTCVPCMGPMPQPAQLPRG